MNQLNVMQYGYLGLVALALFVVWNAVVTYTKSSQPAKNSIYLISAFLVLACALIFIGYIWADKELQNAETKKTTAMIIQSEIASARQRLLYAITPLIKERDDALKQSVYLGNTNDTQEKNRKKANEIMVMIELHEKRFDEELKNIALSFSSIKSA
ncbi:TPA: hypothetical protein ACUNCG_000327 [Aeromonas hydrophila]|uniref:hypothetical protein n=1 Tax=Aeromonas hydrophila TaxID=644 RepID=UPI00191EBE57|nr:hypothetical protein [Aeromonas hydrophila]MBL0568737.1 hypothetical protein [Aeromonas hydrophila]WAF92504.1 hypothetical protein NRZ33_09840 [Aeromonas hydrophila]WAG05229.1 hypothetical protein NRZ28_09820 [Aeromonas hydrophila]